MPQAAEAAAEPLSDAQHQRQAIAADSQPVKAQSVTERKRKVGETALELVLIRINIWCWSVVPIAFKRGTINRLLGAE
jgi:hypothetical protein